MKNHDAPQLHNSEIDLIMGAAIRVLCVDDETVFLNSAKQILELKGSFHVETATSVKEALQKMSEKVFDVIVSDYQMPEKNGLDFLKELKEIGNNIPFVLFTGKGREEVAVTALNLGAYMYFNKFGHPETVYGELAHGIHQATVRRRAEQEIWNREEQLRAILASSPDVMVVTDLHGKITDCNLELLNLLEFSSKADIMGKDYSSLIVEDEQTKVRNAIKELCECGFINNIECRLLTKSGSEIPVEFSANILRDAYSKPAGAVALARNITERKKADKLLRKSEENYRSIVELSPHSIMTFDLNGTITECNPAGLAVTGFSKDELVGKHFTELNSLRKEDLPTLQKLFESVLHGKLPEPFEVSYSSKNGTPSFGQVYVSFIEKGDKVTGFQAIMRDITDHKNAEEALRESEKRFRELSDLLPEVVFEIDEHGFIAFQNQEAYAKFGYSKEDLEKGKTVFQMLVPEDREKAEKIRDRLLCREETGPVEYTALRKDGTTFPIITNSVPIIRDNQVVGIRGVAVDITEHKKAEEALRNSEKRFRELSELLPEVVFEIDSKGILQFVNNAAYTRFGYSQEEVANGLYALQVLVPEDRDRAKENIGKVLRGERIETNEYTAMMKDGSTFQIMINSNPIVRGDEIVGIRGLMVDITACKKTEDALRESEEKFRNLAEQSPNMIFINQGGKVVYANQKCEELTGYTKEEFHSPNFSFLTLISPEYIEKIKSSFSKHLKGEEVTPYDYSLTTKTGKRIEAILATKLIQYKGKSAILGTITDITERKKTESALKETVTKMEALNEKLCVIGKLTRHDTRNKLSTIANNAYLAKIQLGKDHAALTHLTDIESSIDSIEKILEFSRIYEMLGTEELSYINVKKNLEEALLLLSSQNHTEFVNDCYGLTVRADSLLRQIFYNLIDNSLKHGEKVSQIKVYCREEKDCLKLIYEDNGAGIPEDVKEKIFMEGYGKGTGYGLYLIKKICEEYGWTIQETGTAGKGAQFVMTIPKLNKNGKNSYIIKEA